MKLNGYPIQRINVRSLTYVEKRYVRDVKGKHKSSSSRFSARVTFKFVFLARVLSKDGSSRKREKVERKSAVHINYRKALLPNNRE